jgi:hypothetical protein
MHMSRIVGRVRLIAEVSLRLHWSIVTILSCDLSLHLSSCQQANGLALSRKPSNYDPSGKLLFLHNERMNRIISVFLHV